MRFEAQDEAGNTGVFTLKIKACEALKSPKPGPEGTPDPETRPEPSTASKLAPLMDLRVWGWLQQV
jgi:hypothetical protein